MKRLFSTLVKCYEGGNIPKACKDCKFVQPDWTFMLSKKRYEYARCKKVYRFNTVDGSIIYDYASIVRQYECKGEWFEEKK